MELQRNPHPSLLQVEGTPTAGLSQPSSRGWSYNGSPIPAFFKGMEFQQKPLPTFHKGEGAPSKCLKHSEMELLPLGEGWGGASVEGDSGAIVPGDVSGRLLAHDKLEGATCHDVGVGDVVLLILLAVELDRLDVAVVGAAAVGLYGEGLAVGEGDVCAA